MSTVEKTISNIRQELSDDGFTRWTDRQLIRFIQQAIDRIQHIGRRNNLQFLKDKEDFVFLAGESSKALPDNFLVDIGVWNLGVPGASLSKVDETTWENTASPSESSQYMIKGTNLVIQGVPTTGTTLRLWFFKGCDMDSLSLDSAIMPWNGQLDSVIEGYAVLRARNVDRDSTQPDYELLQDLENNVLNTLGGQSVTVVRSCGWLA